MAKGKAPPHGTRKRYYSKTDPCRCAACREANAAYQRDQRDGARKMPDRGIAPVVDGRGHVVGQQHPLFE